jgi:hypothetical protein
VKDCKINQQNTNKDEEPEKQQEGNGDIVQPQIDNKEREKADPALQGDHFPLKIEEIEDHLNKGGKLRIN